MTANGQAHFITLEGGEGAGKSTQAKRLAAQLLSKGITTVLTREPGGSPGAEEIRKLLVEGEPGRWDAMTEALLMFAARADHVARTIRPALAAHKWVIADRFTDSTYVYQGAGRGLRAKKITLLEDAVLGGLEPDLTLILDLPVQEGLKRAEARRGSEDRFEKFDMTFHQSLREGFREIAKANPVRCVLLDATGSEDQVAERIWREMQARFGL
ncbi:MAG TPA: dTMP kinase [Rhizomicrobium sp.]|nr:dTMP kinase [Rhizomicrobium sp.]